MEYEIIDFSAQNMRFQWNAVSQKNKSDGCGFSEIVFEEGRMIIYEILT